MNDWDNLDNLPTDDDDDNDFDWLNDNDQSEDAASNDDGWGIDDLDDDWLSTSSEDDSGSDAGGSIWGEEFEPDAADDEDWQGSAPNSQDSSGSIWGEEFEPDGGDDGGVSSDDFLAFSGDDSDDEVDDFLLGASDDSDDEVDDFLFGASDDSDDEVDDFLFSASDDSDDEVDDFLFGSSDDSNTDEDDSLFGASEDSESSQPSGDTDFLYDVWSEEDSQPVAASNFLDDDAEDAWDLNDPDDSDIFSSTADDNSDADDLGVPDWLADMPLPGEDTPAPEPIIEEPAADLPSIDNDDDYAPDWLSDMPVPGENVQAFDLDDLGDDWLETMGETDLEALSAEDDISVPDWLTGDEEPVADAEDDLINMFDDAVAETEAEDDLLSMFDDAEPNAIADDDLGDLLGDFDTDDSEELGDLLASLDTGDDDGDLDDLLGMLDTGDDDDEVALDDLFAELDGATQADEDTLDALLMDDSADEDDLDFFDGLDAEPADDLDFLEPVAEADSDDLDFFDELDAEPADDLDFLEPVAEADSDDLDFFDELDDKPADDLDFLEPVAEADSDDLDFFDELDAEPADDLDFLEPVAEVDGDDENDEIDNPKYTAIFDDDEMDEEPATTTGSLAFLGKEAASDDDDDEPDWLGELSGLDDDLFEQPVAQPQAVDLDALIDSFDDDDQPMGIDNEIQPSSVDLDSIFDEMDAESAVATDDVPAEALPAWLQDIAQGKGSESAASLIRDRQNRSLDDLEDRLLDLRERGMEMSEAPPTEEAQDQQRIATLIPNVEDALVPAKVVPGQAGTLTAPTFSPQQQQNAAILQTIVGSALGDAASEDRESAANGFLRGIFNRADRIIIAAILIGIMMTPFLYANFASIGALPENEFEEGSPQFAAFQHIENLEANQYVLIATEYGASGARELDTATRSLLEHIIINDGIPVIVSSDAVGLLRAEGIVVDILTEDVRNVGYYVAGLIPGGNVGLRDFSENLDTALSTDLRGNPISIDLNSIDDFGAIIVIADNSDRIRNWMEQIAPNTSTEIIVVAGQSASPIALPYTTSNDNVIALLTGYDDAYTYQQMSLALYNPSPTVAPTNTLAPTLTDAPTLTPTTVPTETSTPLSEADIQATVAAEVTPTEEPTATEEPTEEDPTETPTEAPTATEEAVEEEPTATEEPVEEEAEEPTSTPTEEPVEEAEAESATDEDEIIDVAIINSESAANVRAGAGTEFTVVGTVNPDDELAILERSADEEWVQIVLPDGNTGWIATILINETQVPRSEFDGATEGVITGTFQIGTIIAEQRVNIRSGPGSDFDAVAGLDPDTEVRIIGISDDGDWYNIVLPNNGEGWIATFLLDVREVPAEEWQGASRSGFYPVYYSRPVRVAQSNDTGDGDTVIVGRNASGITVPVYTDETQETVLFDMPNATEFLVLEEGNPLTQILTEDGQIGFIETRLIAISEQPRDEVEFAPTLTPTSTPSPTPTAPPILPEITPMPFDAPEARSSSQALGLLGAIAVIALGNLFWIFRWLGERNK